MKQTAHMPFLGKRLQELLSWRGPGGFPLPSLAWPLLRHTALNAVAGILALILALLSLGTALGAFFTLLASLLVLYFILTQVFGINLTQNIIEV